MEQPGLELKVGTGSPVHGGQRSLSPLSSECIRALVERQRAAFLAEGPPPVEGRIDRLNRSIALLMENRGRLVEALAEDYGHRSAEVTLLTEIVTSVEALKYARRHVRRWVRTESRDLRWALRLTGASARVHWQPKGVVGVISPWNFPVNLTFTPLAGVLAAGNRALVKPSEYTPRTSEVLAELIGRYFDQTELAVITGGEETGRIFSTMPFDHLLFTGSTRVGRLVMEAAAQNLVPVTLELGGKSPVVVGEDAPLDQAAVRIMYGKLLNAGQICLAPDHVFVPSGQMKAFVEAAKRAVARMYPALRANPDYTPIISHRHVNRLLGYAADARAKGAEVIEVNPAGEELAPEEDRRVPPMLIVEASPAMTVMQEEVFGPLLPVIPYDDLAVVIARIQAGPRPLALYYFGRSRREERLLLEQTVSGGVTVNNVILHASVDDLPFGGVGASGLGRYHGFDGFREFSHAKAIYRQGWLDATSMLRPPYRLRLRRVIELLLR